MKKIIIIAILLILTGLIIFFVSQMKNTSENQSRIKQSNNQINKQNSEQINNENEGEEKMEYLSGKHNIEISIEKYGVISAELDADMAPITVTNVINLANEGFYNGLTFHRIIDGFMIQGGDPLGNGTGGSKTNIKGEFKNNGVQNTISHLRGTLSMARSNMPNSASSQFFIVHEDSTFLDKQYAGFGKVTSGIEIVDKICEDTIVQDSNGTVLKENQPKITEVKVIK